jgi:hypothetical protein
MCADRCTRRLNLVHSRTGERAITREQALQRVYLAVKDIDAARKEPVSRARDQGSIPDEADAPVDRNMEDVKHVVATRA